MPRTRQHRSRAVRWLLVVAGWLAVGLATLGVFLPLLPTTPFLLLAAACFAKSSRRFHAWLLRNRLFGRYIRDYKSGRGIPAGTKALAITLVWLTIAWSALFVVPLVPVKVLLFAIALGVTVHLLRLPTRARRPSPSIPCRRRPA